MATLQDLGITLLAEFSRFRGHTNYKPSSFVGLKDPQELAYIYEALEKPWYEDIRFEIECWLEQGQFPRKLNGLEPMFFLTMRLEITMYRFYEMNAFLKSPGIKGDVVVESQKSLLRYLLIEEWERKLPISAARHVILCMSEKKTE